MTKRDVLVGITHKEGGNKFWNFEEGNIIEENEENREIGLLRFHYILTKKKMRMGYLERASTSVNI